MLHHSMCQRLFQERKQASGPELVSAFGSRQSFNTSGPRRSELLQPKSDKNIEEWSHQVNRGCARDGGLCLPGVVHVPFHPALGRRDRKSQTSLILVTRLDFHSLLPDVFVIICIPSD